MAALVFAFCSAVAQFEASRECRGGAFSSGFSRDFDIRRCAYVVRWLGHEIGRVPLSLSLSP
jgi:hypothetical protein